jgi:putative transposase
MSWQPKTLTAAQKAERRAEGGRLLRAGKLSQHQIAVHLGVSDAAVSQWRHKLRRGGMRALAPRRPSGRPPKLKRAQQQQLCRLLKRGARAAGFATERWTQQRVQQLIARTFQVQYHPEYVGQLLHRLGWSVQQPVAVARERDEALIRAWFSRDWPRIKKSAAAQRRNRV